MKILKNSTIVLLFVSLIIISTSCTIKAKETKKTEISKTSQPITVKDLAGRYVKITKKPSKIISLAPSNTEILFALGEGKSIVGVTDYDDYPSNAKNIDKVCGYKGVNINAIKIKKPDVIFAASTLTKDDLNKLISLNIPVIISDAQNFGSIYDSINLIAKVTDKQIEAVNLIKQMNNKVEEIRKMVASQPKVKTYYVLQFGEQNWTGGKGTLIDDIITMAGGINIADTLNGWTQFNPEQLAKANPQVMLISRHAGDINSLIKMNGYKDTDAIKNGRLISIDDNLLTRPGPRIVKGLDLVTRALHPELFK